MSLSVRKTWIELATRFVPRLVPPQHDYQSETANDRWIAEYVFPGKRDGFFVEAGAAEGREGSSCFVLEVDLGWRGICVEPNGKFFAELVAMRPNSICENLCLAREQGNVCFVEGQGDRAQPFLSGIRESLLLYKKGGEDVVRSGRLVERQAVPLAQILRKHHAPSVIDYAAFDIEGSELEALESFPYSEYSFRALTVECGSRIFEPVTHILSRNRYREIKNPFNRTRPWERYWLHRDAT